MWKQQQRVVFNSGVKWIPRRPWASADFCLPRVLAGTQPCPWGWCELRGVGAELPSPTGACRPPGLPGQNPTSAQKREEHLPGMSFNITYNVPQEPGLKWHTGCFLCPYPCCSYTEKKGEIAAGTPRGAEAVLGAGRAPPTPPSPGQPPPSPAASGGAGAGAAAARPGRPLPAAGQGEVCPAEGSPPRPLFLPQASRVCKARHSSAGVAAGRGGEGARGPRVPGGAGRSRSRAAPWPRAGRS